MLIREMQFSDLNDIVDLERRLFTTPWSYKDFLYELNDNQFSFLYVIEHENHIVGYVDVWLMYEQAQIATIGIDSNYQGRGLSHMLMNYVLDIALNKKCEIMSLEVRVSNYKAISLYQKHGFTKEAIRKNYYQDNQEDAYLMLKRLGDEV